MDIISHLISHLPNSGDGRAHVADGVLVNAQGVEETAGLEERIRLLCGAMRAFTDATPDAQSLVETIARRVAESLQACCAVLLLASDGKTLVPTATFDVDPVALRQLRDRLSETFARDAPPVVRQVLESGEPFYAPVLGLEQELLPGIGIHSLLIVPLREQGRAIGQLVVARLRKGSPPFVKQDLAFAQIFAGQAALAIANARLQAAERAARDLADKTANALRQADSRFARLSDSGIIGILVTDVAGKVSVVNDAILKLLGYSREEILSGQVAWSSLTPPDALEGRARAIEQLARSGFSDPSERELLHKDGRRVPVLVGSAMIEGEEQGYISFVVDLTARKEARAAAERLREEQATAARFRALLDSAPDAMVIIDANGVISLVNNRAEIIFGYPRLELIGHPIELLVPQRFPKADPDVRSVGVIVELCGRRKDGTEFPIDVSLSPLETAEGRLVSAAIRDITERKRTDQQRADLAAIVESSEEAIIGKTLQGVITSWNHGAEQIFGYSAAETVGRPLSLLIPAAYEEEEAAILGFLSRGEVRRLDTVRQRKDGQTIDVSVTISPVRDAQGRVVGISNVARDITERMHGEEALARAKDAAEAASSELEAFSYSVAHDLRAPLRGMNGFAQVLLDEYGDKFDAEGKDWLCEILLNAQKMGALIDSLLSLSRLTRSEIKRESVDLSAVGRAAAAQFGADEPQRIVEWVIQDGLRAACDPVLVRALLENLLGNAWKFTAKVPAARIELGAIETEGAQVFYVRDNGAGFDMAFAMKLFAPFQRLHTVEEFPGTGIGLATVQRIVRRHGGRAWAEGTVDGGATFYFTLPATTSEART